MDSLAGDVIPPFDVDLVRAAMTDSSGFWHGIEVVDQTESTNADLRQMAMAGAPHGTVLVAEHQSLGRGRLGRQWSAPPRTALLVSVLLRPVVPPPSPWGWLPLCAALAVNDSVRATGVGGAGIKWPNDIIVSERKLAGILSERVESRPDVAIVVGIGINADMSESQLPLDSATSLRVQHVKPDRESLLVTLLGALQRRYTQWGNGDLDMLRRAYLAASVTLGREVRVQLPTGQSVVGSMSDVDEQGRIVVSTTDEKVHLAVGDVTHLRLTE